MRLWRTGNAQPLTAALQQDVLTGTRLTEVGELEVLSAEAWAAKRKQLGERD